MLSRFILAVPTDEVGYSSRIFGTLEAEMTSWTKVLSNDQATLWATSKSPSRLGHRAIDDYSAIIGIDFTPRAAAGAPDLGWGAYVSVQTDPHRRTVHIYRDPTGRIECWRMRLPSLDILFSHYPDVQWLQPDAYDVNWDYLTYHLSNNMVRGRETGISGVEELLPGEEMVYSAGRSNTQLHWRPDAFVAEPFSTLDEAKTALRSAAELSVGTWAGLYNKILLDLSGGLDSSIVLGLLRQVVGHAGVHGLNYVIPHAEGDEREFARAAATRHDAPLSEPLLPTDDGEFPRPFARRMLRPHNRLMSLGFDTVNLEVAAAIGAEASFTGTGGDHIFHHDIRVIAAVDYLRRGGSLAGLVEVSHRLANTTKHTIWHVFAAVAAEQFRGPEPLVQFLHCPNAYVSAEALRSINYERFAPVWVKAARGKIAPAKLRQINSLSELQRHYWRYGRADQTEEVHPLFSQPLMEASLRTPADWFAIGCVRRGLARELFADILPAQIRTRRWKSSNNSHWLHYLAPHLGRIREAMLDGHLVRRGLVNREALESALTLSALAASASSSDLIHCITVELWARQAMEDQDLVRRDRRLVA